MEQNVDYIIVGAGLAGLAFVHLLEKNGHSFLIFDDNSQKATTTAGAFFNPVVLKRFTPVWKASEQMEQLLPFYREIEAKLGIYFIQKIPILKKFSSIEEQNNWFFASEKPFLSEYLSSEIKREISPYISSPFGLGEVLDTGRLHTKILVKSYKERLEKKEIYRKESFDYSELRFSVEGVVYKGISAKKIVFSEGFGMVKNPFFNYLPMRSCKGELLSFQAEKLKIRSVVKADGFIFPETEEIYKVGATYEHSDVSNESTQAAYEILVEKLKKIINTDFQIIDREAAIRPTVLDRRPLVGKHPKFASLFLLNGLGTRGSMLAPYTATALYNFIEKGTEIDKEMNIRRFEKKYFKEN